MQILSLFISFSALLAIVCNGAPITQSSDALHSHDARDIESELLARTLRPVGPGGRYPEDDPAHVASSPAPNFHPMPHGTYVETHNRVYSAEEVNAQAHRFMQTLPGAITKTSNKQRKATKTYPKPTSGFRPSEAIHDPATAHTIKYHYPMKGRPGNAPVSATTGRTSMRVGTDRIVAWRNPTDTRFHVAVSYHDPHRPIPPTSSNHPFSIAQVQRGSALKIHALKAKKAVQRTARKVTGRH